MILFNDPFLQEFPRDIDLLKLCDSTESAQNTSHHCDHDRLTINFIDISECMVVSLNLVHQSKLNTIRHKSTVVVVNGMNLFNDPFLQYFPRHNDLL